MALEISLEPHSGALLFSFEGCLDISAIRPVLDELDEVGPLCSGCVVDLSRVTHVLDSGVALLLLLLRRAEARRIPIHFIGMDAELGNRTESLRRAS